MKVLPARSLENLRELPAVAASASAAGLIGVVIAEAIRRSPNEIALVGLVLGMAVLLAMVTLAGRYQLAAVYSAVAILTGALVDLPTASSAGGISGLGALTILLVGSGLLITAADKKKVRLGALLVSAVIWSIAGFLWTPLTVTGIQTVMVSIAFLLCIRLGAATAAAETGRNLLVRTTVMMAIVQILLYGTTVALSGPGASGHVSPRAFGLAALISISWALALGRYRSKQYLWLVGLLTIVALLSLSRAAIVTGLLLIPLAWINSRGRAGKLRAIFMSALVAGIFYVLFSQMAMFRERFTEGDVVQVAGGLNVNASGRFQVWPLVWDSAWNSPWIGQGPGSAAILTERTFETIGHPHNDYLRMFHDYGMIGFALWLAAIIGLMIRTYRSWKLADKRHDPAALFHLAAFLALIGISLSMITDNSLAYIFVMAPLGVTLGASLGSPPAKASP